MNHEMRIDEIGGRLERAVATDLRTQSARPRAGWWARLASRRARVIGGLSVAVAIAAPSAAWAAGVFTSGAQEAASLPATLMIFAHTAPVCTVVTANAEYHCTLARQPAALPALTLTNAQDAQLFSMSPEQSREFPSVAAGSDLSRYTTFVAGVRRWRADHDGPLLTQWGFPAAQVNAWVDAMRNPYTATDVRTGHFLGHTEPTTDPAHKVNGACRAENATGTQWQCYLGHAAVQAGVISPDALGGQMMPGPTGDL